jgi:hypothetical protein
MQKITPFLWFDGAEQAAAKSQRVAGLERAYEHA